MTTNEIQNFLLWCVGLNYAVLCICFGVYFFTHDWMCGMHARWFRLAVYARLGGEYRMACGEVRTQQIVADVVVDRGIQTGLGRRFTDIVL